MMNVLIDTNILIPLEDTGRELDTRLAKMRCICSENNIVLKRHPAQQRDISRDNNKARRDIVESRIEQYSRIENPPSFDAMELVALQLSQKNDNDTVDNQLICALYRNAVHLLVTEDRGIHKKAQRIGLQERVHYIDQFTAFLETKKTNRELDKIPLGISECFLHELRIEDSFFDSLRDAYKGFDSWFCEKSREGRKAWIVKTDGNIMALVIQKNEEDETVTCDGRRLNGRALKLCTFKVAKEWRGKKIGERLLYTAFQAATKNKLNWVYLTAVGKEQAMLISLCQEFGFEKIGTDVVGRDEVYCKDMREPVNDSNLPNFDYSIKHYPFYRKEGTQKWLVPIQPHWHDMLFPDIGGWKDTLFENEPSVYCSCANTIKKAYLSHARVAAMKDGDILYFYRSRDRKSVECVGIVEYVFKSKDPHAILAHVSKRTVYSQSEIEGMVKKETFVILFRLLEYIAPISGDELEKRGVKGSIQTIRKINFSL